MAHESPNRGERTLHGQSFCFQPPRMQPIPAIPGVAVADTTRFSDKADPQQRAAQLCQMNADLMRPPGGDRHLQAIPLSRALQQLQFGMG